MQPSKQALAREREKLRAMTGYNQGGKPLPELVKELTSTCEAGRTTSPKAIRRKLIGKSTTTWGCECPDIWDGAVNDHGKAPKASPSTSISITVLD